jgi:hypothetical protein
VIVPTRAAVACFALAVLALVPLSTRAAGSGMAAFVQQALALAPADFASVKGGPAANVADWYATTFPASDVVNDCRIVTTAAGWALDCALTGFGLDDGAAIVAGLDAALPAGFTRNGNPAPAKGPGWPLWVRERDHIWVTLNGLGPKPRISIAQYEKPVSANRFDGTTLPVPLLREFGTGTNRGIAALGSGIVVAEDDRHSYIAAALSKLMLKETILAGDPRSTLRFALVTADVRARDEATDLTIFATPRLHVAPARFRRGAIGGMAVRVLAQRDWGVKLMGRTWNEGDSPPPAPDLGSALMEEPAAVTAAAPASFAFHGTRTYWDTAAVIDAGGHDAVGFALARHADGNGAYAAVTADAIAALLARAKLSVAYDANPAPVTRPAPVAAAERVVPDPALAAFVQRGIGLAASDFAPIKGPVSPAIATWYSVTGFAVDANVVDDCRVEALDGGVWNLDCNLTRFTSVPTAAAAAAVGAALPPGFIRTGPAVWSRPGDDMLVSIYGFQNSQRLWIYQYAKPPAAGDRVDGSLTPVPLLALTPNAQGVPFHQSIGSGIVVAEDAKQSYVLMRVDEWGLSQTLLAGDPGAVNRWNLVPARLLARDDLTSLALVATPRLRVTPARFVGGPFQGEAIRAVSVAERIGLPTDTDELDSPLQTATGIVNAVHVTPPTFEYTAGDGGLLIDATRNAVVGYAAADPRATRGTSGAYFAQPASVIDGLMKSAGLALAYVSGTAPAAPAAPAAAVAPAIAPVGAVSAVAPILGSVARIQAGRERGSGSIVLASGLSATESYVLTAAHVVAGRTTATVFLPSLQRGAEGHVVRSDARRDLALIAIPHVSASPLPLAAGVQRGQHVGVVGFPQSSYAFLAYGDPRVAKLNDGVVNSVDAVPYTIQYDALTDQGDSGGPVFDFDSRTLVGVVHGEAGDGSGTYAGASLSAVRAFLGSPARASAVRPSDVLNAAALAKAQAALVIVECATADALHPRRETGVIVASDDRRSFIVTDGRTCGRTVYLNGDTRNGFAARGVTRGNGDLITVISIERGNLPAARLDQAPATSATAFVLSYVASSSANTGTPIQPRLNGATLALSSQRVTAIRGITDGGGVFDAATGDLVAMIQSGLDVGSLDASVRPEPVIPYFVATAATIGAMLKTAPEKIQAGPSVAASNPSERAERAVRDAVLPLVIPDRVVGGPGYVLAGDAIAVGTRGDGTLLAAMLRADVGDDLRVQLRAPDGHMDVAPVTVVARDPGSPLRVLLLPHVMRAAPLFARTKPGSSVVETAYGFCAWAVSQGPSECLIQPRPVTATAQLIAKEANYPLIPDGHLVLHTDTLGHDNGAPVVDAGGAIVGVAQGSLDSFFYVTMMPAAELADRLARLHVGVTLAVP